LREVKPLLADKAAFRDFTPENIRRTRATFDALPRWVVARIFGWMIHRRRLAGDYQARSDVSPAVIAIATGRPLIRRQTCP